MLHVVRYVREVGSPRFQFFDVLQCALEPKMSLVRTNPETIEHQHFQASQTFDRRLGNLAQVRRVSKIVKAVGHHRQPAMNHFERRYFEIACEAEWSSVDDGVRHDLGKAAAEVRRFEHVLKDSADVFPSALVCIKSERAVAKVQRANIIKSENMIGVTVSNQDSIEMS